MIFLGDKHGIINYSIVIHELIILKFIIFILKLISNCKYNFYLKI